MFDDHLTERYTLSMDRINEIYQDCGLGNGPAADYFTRTAAFILEMKQLFAAVEGGAMERDTLETLRQRNDALYRDILGDNYNKSYANPAYACAQLGTDYGRLLSFLYVEIRGMIVFAHEQRIADMTVLAELFIEIYCIFREETAPDYHTLQQAVYWYVSDYSDDFIEYRVREQLEPALSPAAGWILGCDLTNLRYLYRYGDYITENEIGTAQHLNTLSQDAIERMARTLTEGYRKGFELGNKDLSKKKLANIRYCIGFERLVREEIRQFDEMGLKTTVYRAAVHTVNKRMYGKSGFYATSPNRQMEYDHRFDSALYLDAPFVERKLGALKLAYEKNKEAAALFGGPAVMEIFGEEPFEPVDKPEALHLDEKQQRLSVKYDNESAAVTNRYIKGEERSYTIIAYPIPEIGKDYAAVFDETVRINTLDYEVYKNIQQQIIDVLDGADHVLVKGGNGNRTALKVKLLPVAEPDRQTIFENCVADVNIPLGEVFTSPVLAGTNGVLNVSRVYLNGLQFRNLTVTFEDGCVTDYSCDNFADAAKNRAYFKENVLYNHETLPLGEFAIGTNTAAYVMANKYDIMYKLPILIVEKMGPHFAIGDTCYSHAEEVAVFNPNGKEIIARDNEISLRRRTEPEKAYFNCHTDITVPYDEISRIAAVTADGVQTDIIVNGRFVLPGCEALNDPFKTRQTQAL